MYTLPDPLPFYQLVWDIVRQIPGGQVATYGQIAAMIPAPAEVDPADYGRLGPRWVGDAMNAVSRVDDPSIPWHRVINSKGGISLPDESVSSALQRARLRAEDVEFDDHERVDLDVFGWDGPDEAYISAHGLNPPRSLRKPKAPPEGPVQLSLF